MTQEVSFDIKTGQKLFQPVINTNVDAHNKYRFLINKNKPKIQKEFQVDKDLNQQEHNSTFKISKNSEKLVQKNEQKRLKCIFCKMDSNYDGFISADNIKLEDLTNEELDCLTPFLIYLENTSANVNFDLFYQLIKDPYFRRNLNISQKHHLRDRKLIDS